MPQNRRQTSGSERLNELRRTHPYDSTLQNLLAILTTKLDLCARLPIYEFEADNAGLADAASFFSALASAERESVHELAESLRVHLDRAHNRFAAAAAAAAAGEHMIKVALVANSGPALEAMTSSLASLTNVYIVRHCHGGTSIGRRLTRFAPDLVLIDEMSWPRLALQRIAEIRVAVPGAKVVVRTSRPDAGWLADALRAGASAVIPQSAGPATLGIVLNEVIAGSSWTTHEPLARAS